MHPEGRHDSFSSSVTVSCPNFNLFIACKSPLHLLYVYIFLTHAPRLRQRLVVFKLGHEAAPAPPIRDNDFPQTTGYLTSADDAFPPCVSSDNGSTGLPNRSRARKAIGQVKRFLYELEEGTSRSGGTTGRRSICPVYFRTTKLFLITKPAL